MPPLELHPEALAEARAAYSWYQERNERAATAFVEALDHAIDQIQEAPGRWPQHVHGTRRYVLRRFPFSVVYRLKDETLIEVVAVTHGRRRPAYWKDR